MTTNWGCSMAEPFPTPPSWVVWLTIALMLLAGALCIATVVVGIYAQKWWLISLGVAFCAAYYLTVLRRVFQ